MAHKGEDENGSHYSSSGGATKNVYSKKKRTSFVNENDWWSKLAEGFKYLKRGGSYNPQKIVRSMEKREGLSKNKEDTTRPFRGPGLLSRVEIGGKAWEKERQGHYADAMQDSWNFNKKIPDNSTFSGKGDLSGKILGTPGYLTRKKNGSN